MSIIWVTNSRNEKGQAFPACPFLGQVHERYLPPRLAAELSTGVMQLAGGLALIKAKDSGKPVLLVGLGMVIYSEIVSPGYYAQLGQWAAVVMFALLLFGATFSAMLLSSSNDSKQA